MKKFKIAVSFVAIIAAFGILAVALTATIVGIDTEYREENLRIINLKEENGFLYFSNESFTIIYDLNAGNYEISYEEFSLTLNAYSKGVINDKEYCSLNANERYYDLEEITDEFGNGMKLSVHNTFDKLRLTQNFYFYESHRYFLINCQATSDETLKSNDFSHIFADDKVTLTTLNNMNAAKFLNVPYDNDQYEEFTPKLLGLGNDVGYELGMIFNEETRNSLIIGSVDHDAFKSALVSKSSFRSNQQSKIDELYFKSGMCNEDTRDYTEGMTHGYIYGNTLTFPRVFYSFYDDYRDGLEAFGDACAIVNPPLEWDAGVPLGYNSWAAQGDKLSYQEMIAISDFIKDDLTNYNNDGVAYVNFDSFWDNLNDDEIADVVRYINLNGQKAGIYWCPFSFWGEVNVGWGLWGANWLYTYDDIVLKDKNGNYVEKLYGYGVDPTHPGTIMYMDYMIDKFISWGFEYIKMDFLMHGSFEGEHYDKNITTGTMAYNFGMKYIMDALAKAEKPIFINVAMSPIFPSQYVHSRRISCDVFESMQAKEYMLNSHTYGWWMNGRLTKYSDPDHIVFYKSFNSNNTASYNEAVATMNAAIITGTVMMWSDLSTYPTAVDRAKELLNNQELIAIAKRGVAFRPIFGGRTSSAYYSEDDDYIYVAIFNFSLVAKSIKIPLDELNLSKTSFEAKNLNTGEIFQMEDNFSYTLGAKSSAIFKIAK